MSLGIKSFFANLINDQEKDILHDYIKEYPTEMYLLTNGGFYWHIGDLKPRIEFLNHHIEIL